MNDSKTRMTLMSLLALGFASMQVAHAQPHGLNNKSTFDPYYGQQIHTQAQVQAQKQVHGAWDLFPRQAAATNQGKAHQAQKNQSKQAKRKHDRSWDYQAGPSYGVHPQGKVYGYQKPKNPYNNGVHSPNFRWRHGDRLPVAYRGDAGVRYVITDWDRHQGLYAPPDGARWSYIDGRYVLSSIISGLIYNIIEGL